MPACPEGQRALEARRQRRGVAVAGKPAEQPVKLGARPRVGVSVPPGGAPGREAAFRSRHHALRCRDYPRHYRQLYVEEPRQQVIP